MISTRLFFTFSFVFLSSLGSFIYSAEPRGNQFPRECMPGRSLASLYQDYKAQQAVRNGQYSELARSRERLASKQKDYRSVDTHDTVEDCKMLEKRVIRAEKKVAHNEAQLEITNKEIFAVFTCIGEREYNASLQPQNKS